MGRVLVVLIFCGFVFSTCRKEENLVCTDKNTVKIAQHAKDYFYFKEGTWWVYEEENSQIRDSIWLTDGSRHFENPWEYKKYCHCNKGKCIEAAYLTFENAQYNGSTGIECLYRYTITAGFTEGKAGVSGGNGTKYFNTYESRLRYENGLPASPTEAGGIVENLPSINIKGKEFKEIMHIYYPQEGVQDWLQEAWYAKNIYLVKFRLNDNTTWNLVKYNIVK